MFYKQLERMLLVGNEKVISINSKMNMRLDNSLPTINQLNTLNKWSIFIQFTRQSGNEKWFELEYKDLLYRRVLQVRRKQIYPHQNKLMLDIYISFFLFELVFRPHIYLGRLEN